MAPPHPARAPRNPASPICSPRWSARSCQSIRGGASRSGASPSISPTMASMPTSSCRCAPPGSTGRRWCRDRTWPTSRRPRSGSRSARASGGSISTPRPGPTSPRAPLWAALTGGERVMHVEYTADPTYAARAFRVTPEQYRRLWAAIRAEFRARSRRPPGAHRPPRLRPARRFLRRRRPGQRAVDLQQLGRRAAAAGGGQDLAVAAVRARAAVAVPTRHEPR